MISKIVWEVLAVNRESKILSELCKIGKKYLPQKDFNSDNPVKNTPSLTTTYKFITMGFSSQLDLIYVNSLNNLINSDFSNVRKGSVVLNG